MLFRRAQPVRLGDDAQDQLAAHARNDDVVRVLRRQRGKTVRQNAAHPVGDAEARRIAHGALERRGVDVRGHRGDRLAALQQGDRQVPVVRADVGDAYAAAHEIGALPQPRIERDLLFSFHVLHGIPPDN